MESSYGSQMKGQSDGGGEGGYLRWPDFGRVDGWGQAERGRQRGAGVSGESPQQTRVKVIRTRGGGGTTRQSSKCLRPPPFRKGRAPRRHLHNILPTTLHSITHIPCVSSGSDITHIFVLAVLLMQSSLQLLHLTAEI